MRQLQNYIMKIVPSYQTGKKCSFRKETIRLPNEKDTINSTTTYPHQAVEVPNRMGNNLAGNNEMIRNMLCARGSEITIQPLKLFNHIP